MIVDTLPVFYYEKMVGYMPLSFADLVFVGERIEVGLRRGKFDYAALTSSGNRRPGAGGAKKKEGDAHAVTTTPTWPNSQQTPHNPMYQHPLHQYNYSANIGSLSLPEVPPIENAQSTTKTSSTSPTKSIPYIAQTERKSQPQFKYQPKEELPREKTREVHLNPNAVRRPATILV